MHTYLQPSRRKFSFYVLFGPARIFTVERLGDIIEKLLKVKHILAENKRMAFQRDCASGSAGRRGGNMTNEELFEALKESVKEYKKSIDKITCAWPEQKILAKEPETPAETLEALRKILTCSKDLNLVLEQSPSSIFIANAQGEIMRLNYTFEFATKMDRRNFLGLTSYDLENKGIFRPSASFLVLKEKKKIGVIQHIAEDIVTFGNPVYDETGEIIAITTNALLLGEINNLSALLHDARGRSPEKKVPEQHLIFESEMMKTILNMVDVVKNTPTSILLMGETGVGKGILARYIHRTSNRAGAKIIEINCGAIPEPLLESELFGYESGAFTGANKKGKPGLIEMSDGGTLFLDEISELPLSLQVKLLHFLQDKEIIRLGSTEKIPIDVRVIAASNKPLKEQVEKGLFRTDLYYRLNVIPVTIPPLRERREDIIPIASYFAAKYSERNGRMINLDEETLDYLRHEQWPGNIRELENFIERLVVTVNAVKVDFLKTPPPPVPTGEFPPKPGHKPARLDDIEREMVIRAYEKYQSSYKVAEELGISQTTAYRKIKKYLGNEKRNQEE